MGIAFIIGTGVALTWLEPNDDIRLLYNPSPDLLQDERQVAELMGTQSAGRAIAVSGDTVEQVLANEAALVQALTAVKPPVAEFTAITRSYPRVAQQRQDYHLLETTLYQADGPLDRLLSGLGFSADAIQVHRRDFDQASTQTLRFEDWQASPAGTSLDQLWLGKTGDQSASLILLHQIHDEQALAKILTTQNNAIAIDRVSDISTLLGRYRGLASGLLGAAYLLAGLILCAAFGLRGAFIVLLAPLLASAITALLFAVTGWPFSLFNLMAMVLLLGMGADYGIFLRMGDKNREVAMAAVGLSAVTTLLAFGLLALSQTPALQSFGLTLALGLTLTFLIASLISNTHHEGATNNR